MSADRVIEKALSLVGQGYIYGAKGQRCSPAFREQQAQQYPEQADNILGVGAKWDGVPVWDCAQLTRAAAKEAGVELPSGATSQWNKAAWARRGAIDTLPNGETVFLYKLQGGSTSVMSHTGVALGDGTCVHARGTAYGVVMQDMADYAWTHWASPWAADQEEGSEGLTVLYQAVLTAKSGNTVNVRKTPGGPVVARWPLGTVVDVVSVSDGWCGIAYSGGTAYVDADFLRRVDESLEKRVDELERRVSELENK